MSKKLLMMCHHFPQEGILAYESLMMALTASAFITSISLLFRQAGLLQLLQAQTASLNQPHALSNVLKSIGLYDIHTVYALKSDLHNLHLPLLPHFLSGITWLNDEELPEFLAQHQMTMRL